MYYFSIIIWFSTLLSCGSTSKEAVKSTTPDDQKVVTFMNGADQFNAYLPLLKGKRVACVVNQTSIVNKTHLVDTLISQGINITKIFAPEHGFRGKADAGEKVNNEIDKKTGLPILSIYGSKKKPSAKELEDVDIIIFDIQDVGVRFYTYISTLHYIMEAAAENKKGVLLLDRPNPHAHYIDGPLLNPKFTSFVGMHEVPLVYGLTIGEYGLMINGEKWLANGMTCNLKVIPCKNYDRTKIYDIPIKPSPNLPNMNSIILYPSICLFEGTQLSLGRGTDKQFQLIGHPKLKSDFSFTPMPNEGAKDPFLNGKKCYGEDLSSTDFKARHKAQKIDISYVLKYGKTFSAMSEPYFLENFFFDKLAGTDELRKQISAGKSEVEIRDSWKSGLQKFEETRKKYIIYQ